MQEAAKKSASVLWKKLNVQNKQIAAKRACSYPNSNFNDPDEEKNQEFLQGFTTENEFVSRNEEINNHIIQKQVTYGQNNRDERCQYKQRKQSINSNNQSQNQSITYSIVQKLKLDQDSKFISNGQNLQQIDQKRRQQSIKIQIVKKNLKQLRYNIQNFQNLFSNYKQKIMQEFLSFISKNLMQFLKNLAKNKATQNLAMQNQQIYKRELIISEKQWKLKKLTQEVQEARQQNIELTEKIFDLNQKIYQNDLQTQKKIKALMEFNPRNWQRPNIQFERMEQQQFALNLQQNNINSTKNSRSNKDYNQNIEKIGENINKLTQKVEKLEKGEEKILNHLSLMDKGRSELTRQIIKVKVKQKQLIEIQQLMEAKLSRMAVLQTQLKNEQYKRHQDFKSIQFNHNMQINRNERMKTEQDNSYIHSTPNQGKPWSPKYYKKMSEFFTKNYKSKPETPKVQANVYRLSTPLDNNSIQKQLRYAFDNSKLLSPKNQSELNTGFNGSHTSHNSKLSNLLSRPNKTQTGQNNQIEKLGARIDQLRNQIKKQINASK